MGAISLKKFCLSAAAAALALGAALPAEAGGRHHGRGHGYDRHHGWGHGHYKPRRHYYYGHHRHRGGLSGAEAGVIAAAIIGGAILIDAASDRASYDDRYDDRYYGGYDARYPAPSRYAAPRYGSGPADDYYYRRDDSGSAYQDRPAYEDDYGLEGGGDNFSYNYGAAYNDCKAETRAAASQGGLFVALPAKPQQITPVDDGAAVRFTANFIANDRSGVEVRKTMVCEADLEGVRFLELV